MKKCLFLIGLLLNSFGVAATVYTQDGIQYVNLEEFAQENGIKYQNNLGDLILTKGDIQVEFGNLPKQALINGISTPMSGDAINILGNVVAPLNDLEEFFKISKHASVHQSAKNITTIDNNLSISARIAPNGYFKAGSKELPKKPEHHDGYEVIPNLQPLSALDIFDTTLINGQARLDKTPLIPSNMFTWCLGQVREQLKTPSVATFNDGLVLVYPNKVWTITGEFDSQNSYGAMMRGDYICAVRVNGDHIEGVTNVSTRH